MSIRVTCPVCAGECERAGRGHWACPACDAPRPVVPTFGCRVCDRLRPVTRHVTVGVGEAAKVMCADCFFSQESPASRAG